MKRKRKSNKVNLLDRAKKIGGWSATKQIAELEKVEDAKKKTSWKYKLLTLFSSVYLDKSDPKRKPWKNKAEMKAYKRERTRRMKLKSGS